MYYRTYRHPFGCCRHRRCVMRSFLILILALVSPVGLAAEQQQGTYFVGCSNPDAFRGLVFHYVRQGKTVAALAEAFRKEVAKRRKQNVSVPCAVFKTTDVHLEIPVRSNVSQVLLGYPGPLNGWWRVSVFSTPRLPMFSKKDFQRHFRPTDLYIPTKES